MAELELRDLLTAFAPWLVDIDLAPTPSTQTGFATVSHDTVANYVGYRASSGAQNDEIGWDVVLSAGTWTVEVIHLKAVNAGTYSVRLDGVEVGTVDGHNAGGLTYDNSGLVTGVVVTASGKKRLLLKMATKNAGSANYQALLEHVTLRRTA